MQKILTDFTKENLDNYYYNLKLKALRKQRYFNRMKIAELIRNIESINVHISKLILDKYYKNRGIKNE